MNKLQKKCVRVRSGSLHLTQKVDYGLFLLATLAHESASMSIQTIARESGLSFSFLQKVAGLLQRAGLVHAARGKRGGYELALRPSSITLKEIIEAVEGPLTLVTCTREVGVCPRESMCMIRSGLQRMHKDITSYYLSKKLSDFISVA